MGKNEPISIADEVPFEIPESWEWVRLGSIVYNRGQRTPDVTFCYIDIGSIDNENQRLNTNETVLSPEEAPSRARKIVDLGDILYSTVRPYLHNMCIINRQFSHTPIASTGFAAMTCHAGMFNQYLFYYLMSPPFDLYANDTENSKGVAYPAINDARLYRALIPIPPENEQKRIVERLAVLQPFVAKYKRAEETLGKLNTDFPEQLKKSILQMAVQGKLVTQDPSDEPASVLLERIRAEKECLIKEGKIKRDKNESFIFRRDNSHYEKLAGTERCIDEDLPFDIPDSWVWVYVGDIFLHNTGKAMNSSAKNTEANGAIRPFITTSNVYWNDFDFSCVKEMFFSEDEYKRCSAVKNDILVCEGGAYYGRTAVWKYDYDICFQNHVHRLRGYLPLNSDYFYYVFRFYRETGLIQSKGTAMPGLSSAVLHSLKIPLPPLEEQGRIVKRIEEILPSVNAL